MRDQDIIRARWTAKETDRLRHLIAMGARHSLIARRLGRTVPAVSHKASQMGLRKPPPVDLKQWIWELKA